MMQSISGGLKKEQGAVSEIREDQNGVLTGSSTGFGWASGKVGTALGMDGVSGEGIALPNAFLTGSQGSTFGVDRHDGTFRPQHHLLRSFHNRPERICISLC